MSIDTQEQALAEARKRWGKSKAFVRHGIVYEVGRYRTVEGSGDSWDAAFADADKREGK